MTSLSTRRRAATAPSPTEPRRVLHVVPSVMEDGRVLWRGVEEHVLDMTRSQADHGFVPSVAVPEQAVDFVRERFGGIPVWGVDMSWRAFDPAWVAKLARRLRLRQIAVVHCHHMRATAAVALAARLAGVRAIVETCHSPEPWRLREVGRWQLLARMRQSFWIDRQFARLVNGYIAVSHATAGFLQNKGIPARKIHVIHNGRDLGRFHPPQPEERSRARSGLGLSNGDKAVVMVGRLERQKGPVYLLDAAAELAGRWPSMVVLVAGTGPLEAKLKARVGELGLQSRVRFLGYRSDPENLFAAADVVVLPSLREALGLVLIEALGVSRPVVASAVGGVPEIIKHEETGLLVPPADPRSLAAAIDRILREPELGDNLGRHGRLFVEQHFDVEQQRSSTVSIYRELLAPASSGTNEAESAVAAQFGGDPGNNDDARV